MFVNSLVGQRFNICTQFGVVRGLTFANSLVWLEV